METKLIYKKMIEVMKNVGYVDKNQRNAAQGYQFRGIDDFINAVHPALIKAGVFMTVEVLDKTETLKDVIRGNGKAGVDKYVSILAKYTFNAEDGSNIHSIVAGEGIDSGDKATNKAMSAALKYALIQTLSVPTADISDADAESPQLEGPSSVVNLVPTPALQPSTAPPTESKPRGFRRVGTNSAAAPAPVEAASEGEVDLL